MASNILPQKQRGNTKWCFNQQTHPPASHFFSWRAFWSIGSSANSFWPSFGSFFGPLSTVFYPIVGSFWSLPVNGQHLFFGARSSTRSFASGHCKQKARIVLIPQKRCSYHKLRDSEKMACWWWYMTISPSAGWMVISIDQDLNAQCWQNEISQQQKRHICSKKCFRVLE